MKKNIVIATIKSWNILHAKSLQAQLKDLVNIHLIEKKNDLNIDILEKIQPDFIFFPHWSWIIPQEIFTSFECVVFHMTDLPFGRGGSPLQNLISRKVYQTKVSAIKVVKDLDAGNVYMKVPLNIKNGSASDILKKVSDIVFTDMIPAFLNTTLASTPQQGNIVEFERRTPSQSDLLSNSFDTPRDIYDFVRMLDGEGYPPAFIELGKHRLVFKDADFTNGKLTGTWEIETNE